MEPSPEGIAQALPRLKESLHVVWAYEARIMARLGSEHEVARAYRLAHNAVGAHYTHWAKWSRTRETEHGTTNLGEASQQAMSRFFDASAAVIGPERG